MNPLSGVAQWLQLRMFAPHGVCLAWSEPLLWTYVISDSVIALSYFSIPVALFVFTRKRPDLGFRPVFVLFGLFIFACGMTHVMDVWKIWSPNYWTDALIREVTAVVSLGTAVFLWRLMPRALTVPSPQQLREQNERLAYEIKERKNAEAALKEAQVLLEERAEQLERSNRDLQDFANVASHDLKEPLRAVSGYVGLLEKRYSEKLGGEAKEFIGFAVSGVKRMDQLIEGLLTYSRVSARDEAFEATDTKNVVQGALDNLSVSVEEADAAISHDPLPTVWANPSQLTQLFQNLIANAIKFRGDQSPSVHIGVQEQDELWEFAVRDNGIGMEPRHMERIFELFQRLHARDAYDGSGIGLAVCKRIVERHRGRLWVESAPGQGTTFFFTLPKQLDPRLTSG